MITRIGFASLVPAVALAVGIVSIAPAEAAIFNKKECTAAVADTLAAASENPDLGDKFQPIFKQLVALAESRCTDSQFVYADQLLTLARTMVAAE